MNIFILDHDPTNCVIQYPDQHVVKMITESAQMLSTNLRLNDIEVGYRITHPNHPCTKWARASFSNMLWLSELVEVMHREWQYRYGHTHNHRAFDVYRELPMLDIPDHGLTPFVQCVEDYCKCDDPIEAYRRFYIYEKWHLRKRYKKRDVPWWYREDYAPQIAENA